MTKNLNVKDLINVGIFTVIYFILFFISGILGYIPIFTILIPLLLGIIGGIPFTLFLTKINKFGAVAIMGSLIGLLCFLVGQSWISIIFGVIFGLIADLILRWGKYKSWNKTVIGYCIFNQWVIGSMLPMWIMRDVFFENAKKAASEEYLNTMMQLTANWMLPVVILLGFIGGIIGVYIGRAVLKKHFKRAGIV